MPRALALLGDGRKALLQILDPPADDLPVALELRLAGTAGVDATAEPRHLLAEAGEPRHPVLHLRELDLELALARARVPREDVEDHGGAVDDARVEQLLEVLLLLRRELVVEHDEVGAAAGALERQLLRLALPHPRVRVGRAAMLGRAADDARAGGDHERRELVERVLGLEGVALLLEPDEVRALGGHSGVEGHASPEKTYSAGPASS